MEFSRRTMIMAGAAAVGGMLPAADRESGADTLATIGARTSIRRFDPKRPVDDATIEKLLRAAMCAPTALNSQPWEFVVVRDPAKIKAMGDAMPSTRCGNGAQAVVVVCGTLDNGLGKKEFWIHDCSAATMCLLLAAKALGLGAVWTAGWPMEDRIVHTRRILGVPTTHMPIAIVPIGYPAENPKPKNKWKPARIHKDRW